MEVSKKKRNGHKNYSRLLQQHWPLIVAAISLASLYLWISWVSNGRTIDGSRILYPLLVSPDFTSIVVLCILIPASLIVVIGGVFKRNLYTNYRIVIRSDIVALGLMTLIMLLTCVITIGPGGKNTYMHKDRLELDNQVFNLVGHNTYDDFGDGTFVLYQCDNLSLVCSEIYETRWGYDTSYVAKLTFNSETRMISIIINGEVVHTHQIE